MAVEDASATVYPRECGAAMLKKLSIRIVRRERSIPASAGQPIIRTYASCVRKVGLSPRVRGSP